MNKIGIYPPSICPVGNRLETPVSQGVRWGNLVFTTAKPGRLPDGPLPEVFEDQVRQLFSNLQQILNAAGTSLDHVLMTRVWAFNVPGDTEEKARERSQKFNEIYKEYFKEPYPARGVFHNVTHGAIKGVPCYYEVDVVAGVPE